MSRKQPVLYAIGKVSKAFGLKGEVIIRPMTESPARFKKLKRVFLGRDEGETKEITVEYARVDARGVRLKFVDVPDRTSVEPLVGSLIFVDEEHRVEPKKGTHFVHDIVGLRVVDEDNNNLGMVKDVLRLPAQDVYVIERNGHEWMVPGVKEFVTAIDIAAKTMTIRVIEGLMERE